ncbi:elongation factor Ts [bacterium]|nr:elongation factor Ts [candidate division CSSED10-310 bacterium]
MQITTAMIQDLRSKTGLGIMKCKEALIETSGDIDKAVEYLRRKGLADASKKAHRATSEGVVGCYLHHSNKLGVLVEIFCETDFVAKTPDFQEFAKDIAMHIASIGPLYLDPDSIPEDVLEHERSIYREQVAAMGKPANIVDKIVEGKLTKFHQQVCLLNQQFVKQDDITVGDYVKNAISRFGENIRVGKFVRISLGE